MRDYIFLGGGVLVLGASSLVIWQLVKRKYLTKSTASTSKLANTLRDEKAKSDIILNAIDDGVVLVDEQNVIRLFNPGACRITGWAKNEAEGLDWHSVFQFAHSKGEKIPNDQLVFEKTLQAGQPVRENNAALITKSGKTIAIGFGVSPLLDEHQKVTGLVGTFRDVSEERAEENQRAEFISTASHEMRTPVAAIEGYLSLALNNKVATIDARARDYLEKAHSSTKHLGQLFQDLLTSARAEDGRLTNHPKVVEIFRRR